MSDIQNSPGPQPAPQYTPSVQPRRSFFRSRWFIGLAFVAVALTAFGAGRVSGRFSAWHYMTGYGWERHGGMDGGMRGGMMRGFGPERMLDRVLSDINATNDQRLKIEAIARQTFTEMRPLREQRRAVRSQIATLLQAETVDRAAIERLRTEQLALADNVTKRWSQAIADAAEVLDSSQRRQLVARWENRRGWRG